MPRDPQAAAARIIQDAGGELVGRTRLQKIAFLLKLAGFGDEFSFEYRHYGPYSEDLAQAMEIAAILGPVKEEERTAEWGGRYSVYTLQQSPGPVDDQRAVFVQIAKRLDAVELELAATAAYLYVYERIGVDGMDNPWIETRRRKPSKAEGGRLERAVAAYSSLQKASTVRALPDLPAPATLA